MNTTPKLTPQTGDDTHVAGEMGLLGAILKISVTDYILLCDRGFVRNAKVDRSLFPLKMRNAQFTAADGQILIGWLFGGGGKAMIETFAAVDFDAVVRDAFTKYGGSKHYAHTVKCLQDPGSP